MCFKAITEEIEKLGSKYIYEETWTLLQWGKNTLCGDILNLGH